MVITNENISGWIDALSQGFLQGLEVLELYGYLVRTDKIVTCDCKMRRSAEVFIKHGLLSETGVVSLEAFRSLVNRRQF